MRIKNKDLNKKILSFFKVKNILNRTSSFFSPSRSLSVEDCDEKARDSLQSSAERLQRRENILKQKSRLLLVLLFVAMSVSTPLHSASAAWYTDVVLNCVYLIVYLVGAIVLWILSFYVMFGAWLVDVMLEPSIYSIVLNISDPAAPLMVGWTVIRDFANTFFIFILLLIAFSTILRIQKYSAKAFLPKFIIAIFLINFSALVAAVIIDFGQVFMYEIVGWLGDGFSGNNGAMGNLTSMVDDLVNTYDFSPKNGMLSLENTVGVVFAVAFAAIMGSVYIMLAGFLLIRLVVLAILIVLSPIAFIGVILPGLNSHVGTWWKKIFEYSLFGPIFVFFIFLASEMSSSLGAYVPSTPNDLTGLSYLVTLIVPYCVSIGMLLAVIPVTKQLGIAGSSALIGGTMGVGKIGMGAFAAGKLGVGLGKKAVSAPVGRAHSYMKGKSKLYNNAAKSVSGTLKKLPVTGRIVLKHEVAQAEKKKEAVAQKEKLMDNMTDKDKKNYVDSFKLDRNAKAEAQQAMFNLLAKDSGKGLTNERLQKMGYEKEVAGKQVFDKEKFESDYGRAAAHGMDTTSIEKYRPDLIKDDKTTENRLERVRKTVADGDEKNIKLDVLLDEDIDNELQKLLGKKKYKALIDSKSQEERDGLAKGKEDKIIKGMQIFKTSGAGARGAIDPSDRVEMSKRQKEIAILSSPKDKQEKMMGTVALDSNQNIVYSGSVDIEIANEVMKETSKDQVLDFDEAYLEKYGHLLDKSDIKHIAKFGDASQMDAIKKALTDAITGSGRVQIPTSLSAAKLTERQTEANRQA